MTAEARSSVVTLASKVLQDPKASKVAKSLAGSVLARDESAVDALVKDEVLHTGISIRRMGTVDTAKHLLDNWQREQARRLPAGHEFKVYDSVKQDSVTRYLTVVETQVAEA